MEFNTIKKLAIGVFALLILFYLLSAGERLPNGTKIIVSTDTVPVPGSLQNIVFYFLDKENKPFDPGFTMLLKVTPDDDSDVLIQQGDLTRRSKGVFVGQIQIPSNELTKFQIKIFPVKNLYYPICKASFISKKNVVILPGQLPYPTFSDEELKMSVYAYDRISGKPAFNFPLRTIFSTDQKVDLINRILVSSAFGKVEFNTFIHKSIENKMFFVEFKSAAGEISYEIPVFKSPNPLSIRMDNITPSSLIPGTSYSEENFSETIENFDFNLKVSNSKDYNFIKEVKTEPFQTTISYDCPDSTLYQIELWQNHRLLYASELPVRQGRVVIPLPKGILADKPQRVKIWLPNNDGILSDDYVTTIPIWDSPKNHFKKVLGDIYNGTKIEFVNSLFSDKSPIVLFKPEDIKHEKKQLVSLPNTHKIEIFPDRQLQNKISSISNPSIKEIGKRYFLVTDQVNLSIFGFAKGRVFLSPQSFWEELINEIKMSNYNSNALITEIKARIAGQKHFSTSKQRENLLQLESLMIPFYFYLKTASPEVRNHEDEAKIIHSLESMIHTSLKLKSLAPSSPKTTDIDSIGPCEPFFSSEFKLSELYQALKPNGKAQIIKFSGKNTLNLIGDVIEFNNNIPDDRISQFKNLRNRPVLLEISF